MYTAWKKVKSEEGIIESMPGEFKLENPGNMGHWM